MESISDFFEFIYKLLGVLLSCCGIAFFSWLFYLLVGSSSDFSDGQWSFWFWVAITWPFFILLGAMLYGIYTSHGGTHEQSAYKWGCLIVIVAGVAIFKNFVEEPAKKTFKYMTSEGTQETLSKIKRAAEELEKICPAVNSDIVTYAGAGYYSVVGADYRNEYLGWIDEVSFTIEDSESGHTHYFHLGTQDNSGVVVKKQPTLDFCHIDYQKETVDPICKLGDTGKVTCQQVYIYSPL